MKKAGLLYEGKAKKLFKTDDEDVLWVEYLDQATALNGLRKDVIEGKGALNNQITSLIFQKLKDEGIESHFIEKLSETEQYVKSVEIIPLEVVVRNIAAGSFSKRLSVEEGTELAFPIVEFYYKEDQLNDPFINEDHIKVLDLADDDDIKKIKELALRVNRVLSKLFDEVGIQLVDYKLEFGRTKNGDILLSDEISPDTCRLWDKESKAHLDKDVYRRNLGELVPVYQEVLTRLKNKTK